MPDVKTDAAKREIDRLRAELGKSKPGPKPGKRPPTIVIRVPLALVATIRLLVAKYLSQDKAT